MSENQNRVSVADIDMPFLSMVRFMVKWAIAAIPAFLILLILGAIFWGTLVGFFVGLGAKATGSSSASAISTPSRAGAEPSPTPAGRIAATDQTEYASKVVVQHVEVGQGTLGQPGVFGEVKNAGDKTLDQVEITIYCLGADGKPVFEKDYKPVLVSEYGFGDSNQPLKPGYTRKFGVRLDDAPSEWAKKVEVRVTNVKFAER